MAESRGKFSLHEQPLHCRRSLLNFLILRYNIRRVDVKFFRSELLSITKLSLKFQRSKLSVLLPVEVFQEETKVTLPYC